MSSFIPDIELQDLDTQKKFQEEKLVDLLYYLDANSTFYADLFQKEEIDIEGIKKLEDLQQIPATTKKDLQERNNDFICVDDEKIIDFITTYSLYVDLKYSG